MTAFRPMLASPADLTNLKFPLLASPKLDGIRAIVRDGKLVSRKLLPIPNRHVQAAFGQPDLEGLDGELILGDPCAKDVYRKTNSAVMGHEGEPAITFWVFDDVRIPDDKFQYRLSRVRDLHAVNVATTLAHNVSIKVLPHTEVRSMDELLAMEAKHVAEGHEGLILRDPIGHYKFGRSTAKEGLMLKLKRFEDSEAEVLGTIEEMFNGNTAERDELGRTKRSKAKAGMVGKGTMGALSVRDLITKVEFEIGTGFTAADRAREWKVGTIVRYKHFPIGVLNKPRHPVSLGDRDKIDL